MSEPGDAAKADAATGAARTAGHTPGPWRVFGSEGRGVTAIGCVVATAGNMGCDSAYPETERRPHVRQAQANARLIATAPDLLKAAERALRVLKATGESVRPKNALGELEAAIAKATGAA